MKILIVKQPKANVDKIEQGFITAIVMSGDIKTRLEKDMKVLISIDGASDITLKAKIQNVQLINEPKKITPLHSLTTQETKQLLEKKIKKSKKGISIIYLKEVSKTNELIIKYINKGHDVIRYALVSIKGKKRKNDYELPERYEWFSENMCELCNRNGHCPYQKYKVICDKQIMFVLDNMEYCRNSVRRVKHCSNCLRCGWCKHYVELNRLSQRTNTKWKNGQQLKNAKDTQ